jgi:hypothetical protein
MMVADRLKCRVSGLDDMSVAEFNLHIAYIAWESEQRSLEGMG